jgi:hypothetical protein
MTHHLLDAQEAAQILWMETDAGSMGTYQLCPGANARREIEQWLHSLP